MGRVSCVGVFGGRGEERGVRIIWGELSERGHLEELGIDKMKLYKLILKK